MSASLCMRWSSCRAPRVSSFSPGYTTTTECLAVPTRGRTLLAFQYDPRAPPGRRFSKPPAVASGLFGSFQTKSICQSYVKRAKVRCPGRLPATSSSPILSRLLRRSRTASTHPAARAENPNPASLAPLTPNPCPRGRPPSCSKGKAKPCYFRSAASNIRG